MSLCCIGGVCVPYTAVVPICILAFKWVASKLASYGLLPEFLADLLQLKKPACEKSATTSSCCAAKELPSGPSKVQVLQKEADFDSLVSENAQIVCKFTATWCAPCKKIEPVYQRLSAGYPSASFFTIDVDDFDSLSSSFGIAMMPTFLVLKGKEVKGTYKGSSEHELQAFLKQHVVGSVGDVVGDADAVGDAVGDALGGATKDISSYVIVS
jgi:thioredoxin 1